MIAPLTKEQINTNVEAFRAWLEGKEIEQQYSKGVWLKLTSNVMIARTDILRVKPEPKYRPWKQEEVPVGCLIRYKFNPGSMQLQLTVNFNDCVQAGSEVKFSYEKLVHDMEYTTDLFKPPGEQRWYPCGVLETQ